MIEEYFDVYNENREKTGEIVQRGCKEEKLKNKKEDKKEPKQETNQEQENESNHKSKKGSGKALHLSVHVCVFNEKNEMLIQQRQALKSGWPFYWDLSAGGCVIADEDSRAGAEREIFEELGIKVNLSEIRPVLTVHFHSGFDDVYLIERNLELSELTLQKEEVRDVRWASREEIEAMIDAGSFIPYYKNYIGLLFDMRSTHDVRGK